jgi:CRISPR-associated protein Cas5h
MNSKSFIVFDVSAEYGHFRKFNTTTSPLSYCIPTPTAIAGLLGAILGIEREDDKGKVSEGNESIRQVFSPQNSRFGVRVLNKVNKVYMGFNLLDTSKSAQSFFNITKPTQIEYELLKNPCYRIYLDWQHSKRDELIERINVKRFHFNPYLGLSQFTANVTWVGEKQVKKIESKNFLPFHSAVNLSAISKEMTPVDFDVMKNLQVQVETLPIEMLSNRIITRYGEVLVETTGNPVIARTAEAGYKIEGEGNIQLL